MSCYEAVSELGDMPVQHGAAHYGVRVAVTPLSVPIARPVRLRNGKRCRGHGHSIVGSCEIRERFSLTCLRIDRDRFLTVYLLHRLTLSAC